MMFLEETFDASLFAYDFFQKQLSRCSELWLQQAAL